MVSKENKKGGRNKKRPIQIGFSAESREIEHRLDLNQYLVDSPSSTFFFRLSQDIGSKLRLNVGDVLIVDRARSPVQSDLVLFSSDDGFLIGRKQSSHYEVIGDKSNRWKRIGKFADLKVWGVVTGMVRNFEGGPICKDTMD